MSAEILDLPEPNPRLHCAKCGVTTASACDCGVGYITAAQYAAKAAAANPEKSSRAIAEETGVSRKTVDRARAKSVGPDGPPEKRTGRDGKSYTAKRKPKHPRELEDVAARMMIDEGKTYAEVTAATGVSEGTVTKAVAREQGRREERRMMSQRTEIERAKAQSAREDMLQKGLKNASKRAAYWEREATRLLKALELTPEQEKRLQAKLRIYRTRDRNRLNLQVASNNALREREIELGRRRTGSISEGLWEALIQCTHPDGNPSHHVKTKAFMGLRDLEKILRATPKEASLKVVK